MPDVISRDKAAEEHKGALSLSYEGRERESQRERKFGVRGDNGEKGKEGRGLGKRGERRREREREVKKCGREDK